MAGFGSSVESAAGGALGGGLVGAGLNLVGNLLGLNNKPREDPITQQARQMQLQAQRGTMSYAQSVPGSSPDELAALSQQHGLLGQQLRQQQQNTLSQYNPQMGVGNIADMVKNLSQSANALELSSDSAHMMQALAQRRQALMDVANAGSRVQGPTYQPQSDLPQMLGQISQSIAYNMAKKKAGAGTAGVPGGSGVGPANGVVLGGNGQPGFTPGMPGNTAMPNGGGPFPFAGVLGAAGFSPEAPPVAASPDTAPGIPQPAAANNPYNVSGLAAQNNQQRQTLPWQMPANAVPPWLQFGG